MAEEFTARDLRDLYFEVCDPGEEISLSKLVSKARVPVDRPTGIAVAKRLAAANTDVHLTGPGPIGAWYIRIGGS
jgi:hypothetical protein